MEFLAPYFSMFGFASGAVILAAGAVALYVPPLRRLAIAVAVGVAIMFASYTQGVRVTQEQYEAASRAEQNRQAEANRAAREAAMHRELARSREMDALRQENEDLRAEAERDEDADRIALPKRAVDRVNRGRQ